MARRRSGGLRLVLMVLAVLWLVGEVRGAAHSSFAPASLDEAGIAELARDAGFPEPAIGKAVAVARCESSFQTGAVGDVRHVDLSWGPSIGLWQIRSRHADFGTGRPRDASRLADATFNARAAYVISNGGTGWGAWSCR